ncbi:hypothetical protein OpiT1DRAFT_00016 [Opitutaceae bacterium TAV1]|nr:hypothetical protein OpiT1DRAFT_00016 [Opitutaceae bacterium TAV1]
MKHFYAEQSPRGFANEVCTYRFGSKKERDDWVSRHGSDGDVNSACLGARAITAAAAGQNVRYRGDALTRSYNSDYIDL